MTQVERGRQTFLRDEQIKVLREQIHADRESSRRDREGLERELERVKKQVGQITGALNTAYANHSTVVAERNNAHRVLEDCRRAVNSGFQAGAEGQ
eukprot:7341943-Lingulodinium_polyedra.AAC.1